jgi:hypothetical protein
MTPQQLHGALIMPKESQLMTKPMGKSLKCDVLQACDQQIHV